MAELETVARPYARALFMIAKAEPKEQDQWDSFLYTLQESIQDPELARLMSSPDFDYQQKYNFLADIINQLLKRDISQKESNFLAVICKNKRYVVLPEIYEDFKRQLLAEKNIVRAKIQTAYALTKKQETMFIKVLEKRFKKEIELTVTISSSLLGGAILQIDDLVIDGSILGRLNNMIRSMN